MLLLDVGNSRCKWARIENGVWTHKGVEDNAELEALGAEFAALSAPARIIVSNVGGAMLEQQIRKLCGQWTVSIEFIVSQSEQCGVSNCYSHPARLGSDRWAALIAAWQRKRKACLVVNCGTATTIDALSDTGEFLGGLILPGISLMQQSLSLNTAQLAGETGSVQDFPHNTADAIYSGVIHATIGAIQHQGALLSKNGEVECVLSGGAAGEIQTQLGIALQGVDNLVLEGLQIIGEASA